MDHVNTKLILLSAGGTGGHVFPAKALAEELINRGYKVAFATDIRGEKYLNKMDNILVNVLPSGGYQAGIKGKILGAIGLFKGYIAARKLIKKLNPAVVVGFGGYPSAPPIFAAQHMGIPTILHEQNAILGLANILLAPLARVIALSFENTTKIKPSWINKTQFVGNPVRVDIAQLGQKPYPEINDTINLLIVGGSQGAKVFGSIVPQAITMLPINILQKLHVVHQVRSDDVSRVKELYTKHAVNHEIREFFDDMPARLNAAHLLIARSGASTIAELSAAGRPAIYIPFPWNRDLQQVFNAQNMVDVGGGWMILEQNLTADLLKNELQYILENNNNLTNIANAAKSLAQPNAAGKLADLVIKEFMLKKL